MKELTKAEEQVMQLLWEKEEAFVKELVEAFDKPRPAYNTVSTIIRILETKGFVAHEAFGKTHRYYPLIKKEVYTKHKLGNLVSDYFNGSFSNMVSFFTGNKKVSAKELDDILTHLNNLKKSTS